MAAKKGEKKVALSVVLMAAMKAVEKAEKRADQREKRALKMAATTAYSKESKKAQKWDALMLDLVLDEAMELQTALVMEGLWESEKEQSVQLLAKQWAMSSKSPPWP